MTTELSYRNEGANVYAQDGTLVCIAVDPLDAEVLAGLLRWKVDIHPEPAPEPDPWPTDPLIVATANGQRCILHRGSAAYRDIEDFSAYFPESPDTLTNVVPVTVVPVAELAALREDLRAWDEEGFALLSGSVRKLIAATDALEVNL